jgi:DMSO reductase family type II enzyme heme b subunit
MSVAMKAIGLPLLAFAALHAGPVIAETAAEQALRAAGRLGDVTGGGPLPSGPTDAAWSGIVPQRLRLYPQRSLAPGLTQATPFEAELRAVTDGDRLALRIQWADGDDDRYSTRHTDRFGDAVGVQFASVQDGAALPYVGMGEPGHPVALWFWRAGRGAEALTAQGFGTLAAAHESPPAVAAVRTQDGWAVQIAGPLPATGNPLPIALAAWDGAEAGRDGRKHLSAWHLLRLPGPAPSGSRWQALADENRVAGDPQYGERLVRERGCIACHHLPGGADVDGGPDLTLAGGLHWPGYLRRAMVEPSAFVVPHPRYRTPDGGSVMPALGLPTSEVDAITAYLSSLR